MAIAFDVAADGGVVNPGTSLTWNHTCTGSNRLLVACIGGDPTLDTVSALSYNGVAMTLVGKKKMPTANWQYMYHLENPASGTNQISASAGSSQIMVGLSMSYTGVNQSGQPDSSATSAVTTKTAISCSTTSIADKCWGVMTAQNNVAASTGGTNFTSRVTPVASPACIGGDTNSAKTPAGTVTQTANEGGSAGQWCAIAATFAPATATTTVHRLTSQGAGS